MSNRDPGVTTHIFGSSSKAFTRASISSHDLKVNATSSQVDCLSSSYHETRLVNLEEEYGRLRGEFNDVKEMCYGLSSLLIELEKGGRRVCSGPIRDTDLVQSRQSGLHYTSQLEANKRTALPVLLVDGSADDQQPKEPVKQNGSVPPHLRALNAASNGAPSKPSPTPYLRGNHDPATVPEDQESVNVPEGATEHVNATNSKDIISSSLPPVENLALEDEVWMPSYIATLAPLSLHIRAKIPSHKEMFTFHYGAIEEALQGSPYSPGFRLVKGSGPSILPTRTYYILESATEPFLPPSPGDHGAKLTVFFNEAPEDKHSELFPMNVDTYSDVPMFVQHQNGRLTYYGNYSQTRWSDKLGYDTMIDKVPKHVKEYWADELTAVGREEWVTEALKKHFFPKPEYQGRILSTRNDDDGEDDYEEDPVFDEKMIKDIKKYTAELRAWDHEAKMKTAMMKKEFILDRFDATDVDDPPALRFHWEYLECVGWRKDFYDMLVTLQSRKPGQYLKGL